MSEQKSKYFDYSLPIAKGQMAVLTRRRAKKAKFGMSKFIEFVDKHAINQNSLVLGTGAAGLFLLALCTVLGLEYLASKWWPVNQMQLAKGPTPFLDLFSYMNGLFVQRKR